MSSAQQARERVKQLMSRALATDSEEEARTSALLAVRLIDKHGLAVSAPRSAGRIESSTVDPNARITRVGPTTWHIKARGMDGTCDSCLKPYHHREVIALTTWEADQLYLHQECLEAHRPRVEGEARPRGGYHNGTYWAARRSANVAHCEACRGVILPLEAVMMRPGRAEHRAIHTTGFPFNAPTGEIPFEEL